MGVCAEVQTAPSEEDDCTELPKEETPLHVAASRGHLDCVETLLESGASIDEQDHAGQTALHLALKRKHRDVGLCLIDRGIGLNIQDNNGETALHVAAESDLPVTVQTICQLGADPNVQNTRGLSPLHIAARRGNVEVVRQLCLNGANIHLKTSEGLTAEMMALAEQNLQISTLLAKIKAESARKAFAAQLEPLERPLQRIKLKVFGHPASRKNALLQMLQRNPSATTEGASPHSTSSTGQLTNRLKRFSDDLFNYVTSNGGVSSAQLSQHHHQQTSPAPSQADSGVSLGVLSEHPPHQGGGTKCRENGSICGGENHHQNEAGSARRTWPTSNGTALELTNGGGNDECVEGGKGKSNGHQQEGFDDVQGIDVHNAVFPKCGEFSVWDFSGREQFHAIYDHFVGNTDCIHLVVIQCTADPTEEYKELVYWFNFLKGRLTPSEPLGHCGVVARRSVVAVIGTYSGGECPTTKTEAEAMMRTLNLRFESHFEIAAELFMVDLQNPNSPALHPLKDFLKQSREGIVERLQKPLDLVSSTLGYLSKLREELHAFPCITWPLFTDLIRNDVNPLTTDSHCRQLIQQLQLIGEVVYLRDEVSEIDYIVLAPDWLGTHVIGTLFSSTHFQPRPDGLFTLGDFAMAFPEAGDPRDVVHLLKMLQLCAPVEDAPGPPAFEFPQFIGEEAPKNAWTKNRMLYVYGGMRVKPIHGMEHSLQSIFPRIQVALRRSMLDFKDPLDAMLNQWRGASLMVSTNLEAYLRLIGGAIEIQVRGPAERAASCFYFLEDLASMVEQTSMEVAPGIPLERHFLSAKHLREHKPSPAVFTPEQIMEMEQQRQQVVTNGDGEEERFVDIVCFGSKEVAGLLILGVDTPVTSMSFAARSELAQLLDIPDSLGRDWSILAVKLGLANQLPEVDSGASEAALSRTDQLLAEWALRSPEFSTLGKLCAVLKEMGREDAVTLLYRRTPLYHFLPHNEQPQQILPAANGNGSGASSASSAASQK